MKKIFLATTAFVVLTAASAGAADMSVRPMYTPPPAPVYSWTGIYWGGNVGYSWGHSKHDATFLGVGSISNSEKVDGVIGGVQTGYNYQFGTWVWGFETDIQASGQKGGSTLGVLPLTSVTTDRKLEWFGTSRARLGFLWSPNVLVYGTGGVAYGQEQRNDQRGRARIGDHDLQGRQGRMDCGWRHRGRPGRRLERQARVSLYGPRQDRGYGHRPGVGITAQESWRFTDNIVRVGVNYKLGGGY
jgi:outer membrane immunogenic protein